MITLKTNKILFAKRVNEWTYEYFKVHKFYSL